MSGLLLGYPRSGPVPQHSVLALSIESSSAIASARSAVAVAIATARAAGVSATAAVGSGAAVPDPGIQALLLVMGPATHRAAVPGSLLPLAAVASPPVLALAVILAFVCAPSAQPGLTAPDGPSPRRQWGRASQLPRNCRPRAIAFLASTTGWRGCRSRGSAVGRAVGPAAPRSAGCSS